MHIFKLLYIILPLVLFITITSCKTEGCTDSDAANYDNKASSDDGSCRYSPKLIFKFKMDSNQVRLGNFGTIQDIPKGHAAQTPSFNLMGAHYIELSKADDIPAYNGTVVYQGPTTNQGGSEALDFDKALYGSDGDIFYTTQISAIPKGTYKYLRISLSYQNYKIKFRSQNIDLTGTIASFVGYNTYINSYKINNKTLDVNANKLQGYWAFETDFPGVPVIEGQLPAGATTVPNPLHELSAIPVGSCLVTGAFDTPFEITGDETSDIIITCSISINHSFEWKDKIANGIFEPTDGETVVDMGVRGLIPIIN